MERKKRQEQCGESPADGSTYEEKSITGDRGDPADPCDRHGPQQEKEGGLDACDRWLRTGQSAVG